MHTRTSFLLQGWQSSTSSSSLLLRHALTWSAVLPHLHVVPSGACVRLNVWCQA